VVGSCWLLELVQLPYCGLVNALDLAGWPANDGLLHALVLSQSKMQAPLILCRETDAPRDLLELLPAAPVKRHLRSDRASIAFRPFELKFDPRILRFDRVLVYKQRSILVGDDHVENAPVPKIGEGNSAPVVSLRDANGLRHLG